MPIPPTAAQLRKTPAAAVTAIGELPGRHTHAQIAGILNARGLTSGEGRTFHRLIIRNIRDEYGLRSREQRLRDAGMLTLPQMASRLGVPAKTVKIWHHVAQRYRQQPGQCRQDRPVGPVRPGLGHLAAEHHHLMPQHHDLRVLGRLAAAQQE